MPFKLNEAYIEIVSKGLPKLQSDLKATEKQVKQVAVSIDRTFGKLTRVRSAPFERLTKGVRSYGRAARTYNKDVGDFAKSTQQLTTALEKALPVMSRAARALNSIADSSKVTAKNIRGVGGSLGSLDRATREADRGFNSTSRQTAALSHRFLQISGATRTLEGQFLSLGTAFLGGFGAIAAVDLVGKTVGVIANTLGDSVRQASSLESRLAEVATISASVAENMGGFAEILSEMSVATRTDVGLLSEGLYQTISSGITDTGEALQFLETSAKAARAGLTTVEVAVDGLSSTVNAFGFQATNVGDIADKFFKTVELGKLRFNDLASSIGGVAPLAVELGVSLDELLAAGAALTTGGNTLSQSFTAVRGILNAVLRPSKKATELAQSMGLEFSVAALRTKGLAGFLRDLEQATGGNTEVMGQLFGRVEGLKGVLSLTGKQAEAFEENLLAIGTAAGSTDQAVALVNDTLQGQVDLLNQQLSKALRIVGTELLPVVTSSVKDFTAALETVNWDQFREDVRATIGILLKLIKVAGNVTDAVRGVMNPLNTVRQGLSAGPVARAALSTGKLPVLGQDFPAPGDNAISLDRRPVLQDIAFQFAKTGELTEASMQSLSKISSDAGLLTQALKDAGISKEGLAEAIGQAFEKTRESKRPVATATAIGRAIPLQEKEAKALADIQSAVNPSAISPQPRVLPKLTKEHLRLPQPDFAKPKIQMGEALTRTPIPGVQGQLVIPGVATPDADAVFKAALEDVTSDELRRVAKNTKRVGDMIDEGRLGPAQGFLDAMDTQKRLEARRPPVAIPMAFGEDEGFPAFKAVQEQARAAQQSAGARDVLAGAGSELASNFNLVSSAIRGGAAGGLPGAIVAVGTELLQMTPSFQRITDSWNAVVRKLVMAIDPVVRVLADALEPVFSALAEVVSALEPSFKLLAFVLRVTITPAFKVLGFVLGTLSKGIQAVGNFFIKIINFVIGLVNKIPFVDIAKLPEAGAPEPPGVQGTVREPDIGRNTAGTDVEAQERASGGIQISRITGPTRDIFVELLSPLKQLDSIFPSMLDVLRNIDSTLTTRLPPMAVAGAGSPVQPNLSGVAQGQQNVAGENFGFAGNGFGETGISVGELHIHVDTVADLDFEEIARQIVEQVDIRNRNAGGVFPNNR